MRRLLVALLAAMLGACTPRVVVEIQQTKPMDINFNFVGKLDVTIHAEKDMEAITGEKPVNKVRPEDIGLPPAGTGTGAMSSADGRHLAGSGDAEQWVPVKLSRKTSATDFHEPLTPVATTAPATPKPATTAEEAKAALKARDAQVRALWDGKTVGESHTGLLVLMARATLTEEQQKLVDAENADRTVLYKAEAAATKAQVEAVALIYYTARLGYAKKGAWYDKRNAAGDWEWKQWGM